ncbi:MAG: DUF5996 family protein [Methyloceanibacter sp.]|nr:DUF5996 family protein [Methyloceanibacter sp.]
MSASFPPIPYPDWEDTKLTLHLMSQIVGKIRMAVHPKLNHWWHVVLYPEMRGLTTGRIPNGDKPFSLTFDLIDQDLVITEPDGSHRRLPLAGQSIAGFHNAVMAELADFGVHPKIIAKPYDMADLPPFAEMTEVAAWDADAVRRFHRALLGISCVFETFRGDFCGKQTPVQLYWHSFDMVVTRFSGRAAPPREGTKADKEAYSHEVISCGFWPGDATVREPMFYSYTYPEPGGLGDHPLRPETANWAGEPGGLTALMPYEAVRTAESPSAAILDFLESTYDAGATAAGWDKDAFRRLDAERL